MIRGYVVIEDFVCKKMNQKSALKTKKKKKKDSNMFDLLDEAFFLLRENLLEILPLHFTALVPFLLCLGYFVFRFGNYHSNEYDIVSWSILLTALFCWKCFFECLLAKKMMDIISRREPQKLTAKAAAMIFFKQILMQTPSLLLLLLVFEMPWLFGICVPFAIILLPLIFYTATVICAIEPEAGMISFIKKIFYHISKRFVSQTGMMLAVLLGTIILTFNITAVIFIFPALIKMFTGIETQFTVAGLMSLSLFFNTTIWTIIFSIVWLIIDPFCRLLFVLRVFYSESIGKGWDIKATLSRLSSTAVKMIIICTVLFSAINIDAQDKAPPQKQTVNAEKISESISQTQKDLEFKWRRPGKREAQKESWVFHYVETALKYIAEKISEFTRWLKKLFWSDEEEQDTSDYSGLQLFLLNAWNVLKYVLPVLVVIVIILIVLKVLKNRAAKGQALPLKTITKKPDLNNEDVTADDLEEHEWLSLSSELMQKGKLRLSLRALYLACISALADRKLLLVARYKTDYEYLNELKRRAHSMPETVSIFESNVGIFQRVWYGEYPVDLEMLKNYRNNSEILFNKPEKKQENKLEPDSTDE